MSAGERRLTYTWSSTLSILGGVTLYLRRDEDGYIVTDLTGRQYGWGETILGAISEWAGAVEWLCTEPSERLADPILSEQGAYVTALRYFDEPLEAGALTPPEHPPDAEATPDG